jgi:predicted Na+-dependent transporter
MGEFLATLQNLFTFAFVVSSMLAMGLSLTVGQILQPLSNRRLVALALVANFVIVPGTAYLLAQVIPMDEPLQIGLILMGAAAGAPFLPKLAQIARANVAFAVGLMALLVVVTVAYLPLVLPLLLPGVEVDARQIAITLFGEMLVPLAIGLFVRARWAQAAAEWQPHAAQISNLSLVLLLVLMLGLNIENVIGLFGSGALLATLILVAVAIGSGYLLGGPGRDTRQVLAIGTGQRNLAATFLIAGSNFSDQPDVLVFLAGAGLIGMALVMPLAAEFGKRAGSTTATPAGATSSTGEHAAGP